MDPKLLTENGWKTIVQKYKVKDNGLQGALGDYEDLKEDDHAERLKAIARVNQLAASLVRVKEIAANKDVVDYLDDVQDAADAEQQELAQAKVAADKAEAQAKKEEQVEDKYEIKLWAALQKLRSSRGVSYEFILCLSQPYLGVLVAPRITQEHKAQLTKIFDSKRFLPVGSCSFDEGKYAFNMDRPPSGLARKIQDSLKNSLSKKLPIIVGTETADEDENS